MLNSNAGQTGDIMNIELRHQICTMPLYGAGRYVQHLGDSLEIEDRRWARNEQIKDWLKLGLIIVLDLGWMIAVYFLEPGLR